MNKKHKIVILVLIIIIITLSVILLFNLNKKNTVDDLNISESNKDDKITPLVLKYEQEQYKVINVPTSTKFSQGGKKFDFRTTVQYNDKNIFNLKVENNKAYFEYKGTKVHINISNVAQFVATSQSIGCDIEHVSIYILTTNGDVYANNDLMTKIGQTIVASTNNGLTKSDIINKLNEIEFTKINKILHYTSIETLSFEPTTCGYKSNLFGVSDDGKKYQIDNETVFDLETYPYNRKLYPINNTPEYYLKTDGSIIKKDYFEGTESLIDTKYKYVLGFSTVEPYNYYFINNNNLLYQITEQATDKIELYKLENSVKVVKIAYKLLSDNEYDIIIIFENGTETAFKGVIDLNLK